MRASLLARGAILASLLLTLLPAACSSGDDSTGSSEEAISKASLNALVDRAQCAAGNGTHDTSTFNTATFDAAATLRSMKEADRERGCRGRDYSASKEDGVAAFKKFLVDERTLLQSSCEDRLGVLDSGWKKVAADLSVLVNDPTNRGVFTSVFGAKSKDDPFSCFYYRFFVLTGDGKMVHFDFDFSD